jgi:ABC-type sugar transport system ATPase subunit
MAPAPPLLAIHDLTRHVAGRAALESVDLMVHRGEIIGLMGASGAGKTTLLSTLAGGRAGNARTRPDARDRGRILWEGRNVTGLGPRASASLGIAWVPQAPVLPDGLTVADAISLGNEPLRFGALIDFPAMVRRATEWLERLGAPIDPAARLGALAPAPRQMVALARALATEPRLLLLDTPTAALRPQDTDRLFEVLGDLQAQGTSILYVSDRLGEIEALASRVVVMRDGRVSGELARHELNLKSLGALMVGKDLDLPLKELIEPGIERLRVDGLRTTRFPESAVRFTVREGEIIGLAGLLGSGRTAVLRAIFGLDRALSGSVTVNDVEQVGGDPRAGIAAGMAFVPAGASRVHTAPGHALRDVLALPSLPRLSPAGIVNDTAVDRLAWMVNEHLSITDGPLDQPLDQLTHGQRQKAALASWLALKPTVVLLDEPTRGVDLAARAEIYETLERLAERGAAVVFASNDMDELLRVADRLLVFREGALAGELTRDDDFTERGIMRLAAGLGT